MGGLFASAPSPNNRVSSPGDFLPPQGLPGALGAGLTDGDGAEGFSEANRRVNSPGFAIGGALGGGGEGGGAAGWLGGATGVVGPGPAFSNTGGCSAWPNSWVNSPALVFEGGAAGVTGLASWAPGFATGGSFSAFSAFPNNWVNSPALPFDGGVTGMPPASLFLAGAGGCSAFPNSWVNSPGLPLGVGSTGWLPDAASGVLPGDWPARASGESADCLPNSRVNSPGLVPGLRSNAGADSAGILGASGMVASPVRVAIQAPSVVRFLMYLVMTTGAPSTSIV